MPSERRYSVSQAWATKIDMQRQSIETPVPGESEEDRAERVARLEESLREMESNPKIEFTKKVQTAVQATEMVDQVSCCCRVG